MSKIVVIITDLFEDSEYTEPVKAFKEVVDGEGKREKVLLDYRSWH